jgi:DNA processing protein
MQNKNDLKYLNAINKISGIGPQKMRKLLAYFSSPEDIWNASLNSLLQSEIGEAIANKFILQRTEIDPEQEWQKIEANNVQMIIETDERYPKRLKEIPTAPYILYLKGDVDLNAPMISIVGSRKYTPYGSQIAHAFARDLSRAGITVVSGMALGIDAIAHQGALSAHGKTIAVLGNSLDDQSIYPRNNFNLSREIIQQGALLSEYPIETPASNFGNFPARNRIVAGLSLGTLIIEAGEKSGTLITANLALEFNREVFSVPGSIFSPQSIGTNSLIRNGAKVVTSVQDILAELDLNSGRVSTPAKQKTPASKEEEILLKFLSPNPTHIDKLSKLSTLGTSTVAATLALMEIKGWIKNIGGQNYILL